MKGLNKSGGMRLLRRFGTIKKDQNAKWTRIENDCRHVQKSLKVLQIQIKTLFCPKGTTFVKVSFKSSKSQKTSKNTNQ